MLMSRFRDADDRCEHAIALARSVGARAEEGHALNTLGCCRAALGQVDEGIALVRESLAIAEEVASPDDLNRAYANLSVLLMTSGQLEEAVAVVANAVESQQLGGIAPTCALIGADALTRLGRWDQAEDFLSGLGNLVGICGNSRELVRAPIALHRGRFDEAARLLATADEITTGLAARLAAEGCSAKEMAERLFIGERTVETHLANAYAKVGVSSKVELVRFAVQIEL